jgi:uncharacterized protein YndB with AHSA1/START domain
MKDMRALAYRTETVIRRSPEEVFDFCSDLRSELQWNPKAKYVEKLTHGPVGVGTRYRARWSNSGPTAVEVVAFDRPRSWETTTRARGMVIRFRGTVTDGPRGALHRLPGAPTAGRGLAGGASCHASHAPPGPAAHAPHQAGS